MIQMGECVGDFIQMSSMLLYINANDGGSVYCMILGVSIVLVYDSVVVRLVRHFYFWPNVQNS